MSERSFPASFIFGAAAAAYQIEGAAAEGGRTPSIWDTYAHTPGLTEYGDTGDVACDHYHRWEEDVEHLVRLGVDAYRLSISWSRVMPHGGNELNPEGVAFYRDLLTRLRERGIAPYVTLYHWDLPQELEDAGGWPVRGTAYAFARYARAMAEELGDLVEVWTTLNEPWCSAYLGYASGVHAPGRTEPAAALAAVHHLNLAHGLAAIEIRDVLGRGAKVSATLNMHVMRAQDPTSEADLDAVRQIDALANRAFLEPMINGRYPEDLLADTASVTDWSFVEDGDLQLIQQPMVALGVNYYSTTMVRHAAEGDTSSDNSGHRESTATPWIAADHVAFVREPGPYTAMGWNIAPEGLTEVLLHLNETYPGLPLIITENGAAFEDEVSSDGVHDDQRVDYLRRHIGAVADARAAGADVRGYFAWSLLDNFEWAWGYSRRFGIIRVDYDTLERTWKDSALWYRDLLATRRLTQA